MTSKRFSRRVLLSSCCFAASAIVSSAPAVAADYPVTSGTQVVTAPITGTDTLTKTTTGTYILTAANTSTGTTTISAGTLQIGTTAPATSVFDTTATISSASIVNSGTLTFNRGDGTASSYTYSGLISGTGALKQIGYGTVILTANNTYTGTTTLTTTSVASVDASGVSTTTAYNAILQLGNGGTTGWIGSSSVVVGSNSTLIFNRSDNVIWTGVISSSGNVTQLGTGTLTYTGVNTYSGTTTITNGSLLLSGTGAVASSAIVNNAIFDVTGVTAAGVTLKSLAGTTATATLVAGAKNVTFTSGATYAGLITGSGIFTVSGGTEILTGDSTGFTGTIVTSGSGTLQFGSATTTGSLTSTSAAITNNGTVAFGHMNDVVYTGLISGTGALKQVGSGTLTLNVAETYTGLTTVSAGTLVIGDASHTSARIAGAATVSSSGTLAGYGTIAGALTNAGTVKVGLGTIGNLNVGGAYTQTGTLSSEITPTTTSVLMVGGAATLGGTFVARADAGNYGQFAYTMPILQAASVTGTFANPSGVSGDIAYGVVYPSATEVDVLVVPKASSQVYGDVITETLENTHALNDIAVDHAAFDRCNNAGSRCRGWSSWIQAIGGINHVDASNGADAFNGRSWGVIGGLGYTFNNEGSLNLAVAYSGQHVGVTGGDTRANTHGLYTALTLHMGGPVLWVDLNGFFNTNKSSVTRDAGLSSFATSSQNSTGAGFTFQVAAPLLGGDVTPVAKAVYAFLSYGPFTEVGAGNLNLQGVHGQTTTGYYDIGVRLSHLYALNDGISLRPHAYVGAQVNGTEGMPNLSVSLVNWSNTTFDAPSSTLDKFSGVLKVGVDAKIDDALSLQADVNSKFGSRQLQVYFTFGANYRF
jgi:autotransporter-associated beta strand protein